MKLLNMRRGGTWGDGASFMRWKETKFKKQGQRRKNQRTLANLPLSYDRPLSHYKKKRGSGRRHRRRH